MAFSVPFLATGPVVKVTQDVVRAATWVLDRIVCLGAYAREVEIDSRTRTVRIRSRSWWVVQNRTTIPFDNISYVTYGMRSSDDGLSYVTGEREGGEAFTVGLGLKAGRPVDLFQFSGDGELSVGASFPWDVVVDKAREATDISGTQQEDSIGFVDLVCERIGVKLGP